MVNKQEVDRRYQQEAHIVVFGLIITNQHFIRMLYQYQGGGDMVLNAT